MNDLPAMAQSFVVAWVLLVGAVVGSFLNVVVARLPQGQSIVRPRSRCPSCGTTIAWYDNIPILSWLVLRARCRQCRTVISARYPLVEALGAGAAWMGWARHGLSAAALAELVFVAAMLALAFIDLDTWLLPQGITRPLVAAGLGASALHLTAAGSFRPSICGAVIGYAAFAAVSLGGRLVFRREALGWGDVWLLAGLGSWLGAYALLPVVLLASVQGSLVGLALILLGKATPGPPEPTLAQPPVEPPTATSAEPSAPAEPPTANPADSPTPTEHSPDADEEDWIPPKNSVPFGPFLALGALEWLYLAGPLARLIPPLQIFR